MNDDRHSEADEPSLIADPEERAQREAINALAQFDRVLDLIDMVERDGRPFKLRVSIIQELHRLAWTDCPHSPVIGDRAAFGSAKAITSRRQSTWSVA